MSSEQFDKTKIIEYWKTESEEDYSVMQTLYEGKKYNWALFLGHLLLEKLLKAYYVKVNETHPPYIHNLLKIASDSKLVLNKDQKEQLATISAFNLQGRYDDYKKSFKQKCTPEYTEEWLNKIGNLRLWIKQQI